MKDNPEKTEQKFINKKQSTINKWNEVIEQSLSPQKLDFDNSNVIDKSWNPGKFNIKNAYQQIVEKTKKTDIDEKIIELAQLPEINSLNKIHIDLKNPKIFSDVNEEEEKKPNC